jgi:hypothetical protein
MSIRLKAGQYVHARHPLSIDEPEYAPAVVIAASCIPPWVSLADKSAPPTEYCCVQVLAGAGAIAFVPAAQALDQPPPGAGVIGAGAREASGDRVTIVPRPRRYASRKGGCR